MTKAIDPLDAFYWPVERLSEALELLAQSTELTTNTMLHSAITGVPAADIIDFASGQLGIETEAVSILFGEEAGFVRRAAPAVLRIRPNSDQADGSNRYLLCANSGRRTVELIGPDLTRRYFQHAVVAQRLVAPLEASLSDEVDRLLETIGGGKRQKAQVRRAILQERLGGRPIAAGWVLRLGQQQGLWPQLKREGVFGSLAAYIALQLIQFACWYGSWFFIGRIVFQNRFDTSLFVAWALLLISIVPLRGLTAWLQGQISVRAGMLVKQRLMAGALNLSPDQIRSQGTGQLLGRVHESEAVETLVFRGGFLLLTALIELFYALWVLALGSGGLLHAVLLIGWIGVAVAIGRRYLQQRQLWTDLRLDMTHDLVEQMLGHRTRQMQGNHDQLNRRDDQTLARYLKVGSRFDDLVVWLTVWVPRSWLAIGVLALLPALLSGRFSPAGMAIAVGGILSAFIAFEHLTTGIQTLTGAQVAAERIRELLQAAGRQPAISQTLGYQEPTESVGEDEGAAKSPLLLGRNLTYRYPTRQRPVLNNCDLEIFSGDKILLEGASGGGKSTLAALLTGLRRPDSGLLLLKGHDFESLGENGWHGRVASAPQFHENHVLTESFAFNLLMGRNWPPQREDVEAAYKVCYGLGLGPLLERMPGGLFQMVGETGWQLSHGERNRLFLARALLQQADLVVLDESLAGLDPATYQRAMATIEAEAPSILIILHR